MLRFEMIDDLGGATTTQLAEILDRDPGNVSRDLGVLTNEEHLLEPTKRGREVYYHRPLVFGSF